MSLVTKNNTFSSGATIIASEHNDNFDTIYNAFNGNISNANISASAAIAYSKLNLTGTLLNADVATDASIAASKLNLASPNQIGSTTPSKGTFTNLTADTDFTVSTGATVTAILDQDDMHGDSSKALATQQSIKAYSDNNKNTADAGDFIDSSADTERTGTGVAYELKKDIEVPRSGTYRITWDMKSGNGVTTTSARVYRDGVAVGVEKTTTSDTYVSQSDDVSGWSAGDDVELWLKTSNGGVAYSIRNFRIKVAEGITYTVNTN